MIAGLTQDSTTQLLVACLRCWSNPKEDCWFPLAHSVANTDLCCTLPRPLPPASLDLVLPLCSAPGSTRQRWVWHWGGAHSDLAVPGGAPPAARCVPPLRHLDLSCNSLGASGAKLLGALVNVSKLLPRLPRQTLVLHASLVG